MWYFPGSIISQERSSRFEDILDDASADRYQLGAILPSPEDGSERVPGFAGQENRAALCWNGIRYEFQRLFFQLHQTLGRLQRGAQSEQGAKVSHDSGVCGCG